MAGGNVNIQKRMVYPDYIKTRVGSLFHNEFVADAVAIATEANFRCGSFVRFSLSIDDGTVTDAGFSSNGCGFMLAAADLLADYVSRKNVTELHGLAVNDLIGHVDVMLGNFPLERRDCVTACVEAVRSAFANFRKDLIEEFRGEKALICTCFGVTEETIETVIVENSLIAVDQVTEICNAGGGCGSCRMLIQEMLDSSLT
jgi:NifU-like protein